MYTGRPWQKRDESAGRRAAARLGLVSRSVMPKNLFVSEAAIRRVRAEFLEMPGLKLTVSQAQRLWGIDRMTCEALIDELVVCQFLTWTRDGAVVARSK